VSGMDADKRGCFKTCEDWCDDHVTDHYRASWGDMFCDDMHGSRPEWCVGRGTPESAFNEGQGGALPSCCSTSAPACKRCAVRLRVRGLGQY